MCLSLKTGGCKLDISAMLTCALGQRVCSEGSMGLVAKGSTDPVLCFV